MSEENERLYEEVQRRLREVTTLYEASQACLSISDQKGLLTAIIEAAARAIDATLGSVMLIDERKGEYVFGAHYGLSEETIAAIEAELHTPLGKGLVGAVVTTGQPVVVADVRTDPRWIPSQTKELMRSFLGVPLVGRDGQSLGALNLARPDVGAFDEDHAGLLSTFANLAAMAIENARLYEQAQARSRYLETLQRINATLRSTLPLSQVLETITQSAGEALHYVGSLIAVPDANRGRLNLGAVWGNRFVDVAVRLIGLEVGSFSLPLAAEENPMTRAYLKGELQAWSGEPERIIVGVEPPISPKLAPVIERAMGARLVACVPLPVGEKVVGVLVVFCPREHLSDEEQAMLLGLADQAGLAIENARLYEQAQEEIIQRKRAIETLRESEERYRRLVELSFEAIIIHREGKVVYINAAGAQLFGASSPEELVGRPILDFVHPDYLEIVKARVLQVTEGNTASLIEEKLIRLDGTSVDAEVVGTPITYQGQSAVQVVIRDITERKRAEEALRESEEKFRNLAEQSPNMIFINKKGKVVYANKKCEEVMGYKREEFYSPDFEFLTLIAPEYIDLIETSFSRHMEGEDVSPYEYALITKEGTRIEAIITTKLIIYEGESAILGTVTGITERKRAEEALRASEETARALLNAPPESAILLDTEGTILAVNETAAQRLGESVDELVGLCIWDLFLPAVAEFRKTKVDKAIRSGEPVRFEDERRGRFFDSNVYPVFDTQGEVARVAVFARDITEQKKLEEQLRQAQKMEAIGTLAGGIAHDFNNILTGILGFASVVHSELPADSLLRSDVETIIRSARRGSELTRQLLAFARRAKVEVHPLGLNDVAREVVKLLERTIDKAIALEPHLADDLAILEGDAGQLHQMLLNLCLNARDAMPQGGRLIIETQNVTLSDEKARAELDLEAGPYVVLSVTDTGIGMDAETQRRLFEPFFTTKKQGRGLGLAMVYGIVRRHRGAIHVYSELGQGSTFKVYLPVASRPAEDTALEEGEVVGGTETVLVVDDEEPVRDLLRRILEESGYTVLLATDGVEATELYAERSTEIDLVVLDIIMPQMGGRETYERLREINPEVEVLLSSGYSENGQAKDILAAGARGFLQKPYDRRAVLRKVREVLD